jgi:hypothetical protein
MIMKPLEERREIEKGLYLKERKEVLVTKEGDKNVLKRKERAKCS